MALLHRVQDAEPAGLFFGEDDAIAPQIVSHEIYGEVAHVSFPLRQFKIQAEHLGQAIEIVCQPGSEVRGLVPVVSPAGVATSSRAMVFLCFHPVAVLRVLTRGVLLK